MKLMEYGSFVVDAPDANAKNGIKAMSDTELAVSRHSGGPVPAVVFPAEIDPRPYANPERYVVFNTQVLGIHGLKAVLRVGEEGRASLTIDTEPPIEAEGLLVRLDPHSRYGNRRPNQLTFIPQLEYDKAPSVFRDRLVDI